MVIEALEKSFFQNRASDLLKGMREKAWDHFLELGIPEKSDEPFRYVPLRRLYETEWSCPEPVAIDRETIASYIYPECKSSYLVFINGTWMPELSDLTALPKKVVALPIVDAMRSYGPFLQNRWSGILKEELDPFAILNLAIHQKGLFFYVPPKCLIEAPIQTLFLTQGDQTFAPSRIQLFAGAQSEMKWISTIAGNGVHNTMIDLAMEEGGQFDHLDIPYSDAGWHLNYLRASLKRDCRLKNLAITRGPRLTRHSLKAVLKGENADALLQGLWQLDHIAQSHTHVEVEHAAPMARSLQKFKGVLAGNSQSSFEGKIFVRPIAQKTEAYQLNQNLLLSDHAIANAKPNLEIFADDVKASHGATVSQVDEESLFYLKSRGIAEPEAKKLLIEGFVREITDQIPYASIREGLYV